MKFPHSAPATCAKLPDPVPDRTKNKTAKCPNDLDMPDSISDPFINLLASIPTTMKAFLISLFSGILTTFTCSGVGKTFATPEENLEATVRILVKTIDGRVKFGSGFFLNEGDCTYVVTNAHVLDQADQFAIYDNKNNVVSDFEFIECFKEPFGEFDGPTSGDGVRLKLKNYRESSFKLSDDANVVKEGRKVIVFGDNEGPNDGKHEIEILAGKILNINNGIVHYDCKTKQGSSGGAVVDSETMAVIALNTWVLPSKDPFRSILGVYDDSGFGIGVVLKDAIWTRLPINSYLNQIRKMEEIRNNIELMMLLTYLTPKHTGIYASYDSQFVAGMTVGQAVKKHENNPIMKELVQLYDKLEKNKSNIPMSSRDTYKIYRKSLEALFREREKLRQFLNAQTWIYFYNSKLELIRKADFHYYEGLSSCANWFAEKLGVGGTIPLWAWETLPPLGAKLSKSIEKKLVE